MDQYPYFIMSPAGGIPMFNAVITPITTLFPITPFITSPLPWLMGTGRPISGGSTGCASSKPSSNIAVVPSTFGPVPMLAPVPGSGKQTTPRKNYRPTTVSSTSPSLDSIPTGSGNGRQIFLQPDTPGKSNSSVKTEDTFIDPIDILEFDTSVPNGNIASPQYGSLAGSIETLPAGNFVCVHPPSQIQDAAVDGQLFKVCTNIYAQTQPKGICVNFPNTDNRGWGTECPIQSLLPSSPGCNILKKRMLRAPTAWGTKEETVLDPLQASHLGSPTYTPPIDVDASSDSDYGPEPVKHKRRAIRKGSKRYSLKVDNNLLDSVLAGGGLKSPIPCADGGFGCPSCDKVFKMRKHCRRHMVVHTGSKPFQCTVCDAQFCRQDSLQRHSMKCGHGDAKPQLNTGAAPLVELYHF